MHAHAQTAARSTLLRRGLPLVGVLAAALLAAPTASANTYHVDLDSSALIASARRSRPAAAPTADTYNRVNGHGVEVQPASGAYVPAGAWGVTAVYAPAGTAFLNSAVTWTTCAPNASGQFTSFLTGATAPGWLGQGVETAAGCTERTWPGAFGFDAASAAASPWGCGPGRRCFGANAGWHADLTRVVADIAGQHGADARATCPADASPTDRAFRLPVRRHDAPPARPRCWPRSTPRGSCARRRTTPVGLVAPANSGCASVSTRPTR